MSLWAEARVRVRWEDVRLLFDTLLFFFFFKMRIFALTLSNLAAHDQSVIPSKVPSREAGESVTDVFASGQRPPGWKLRSLSDKQISG